METFSAGKMSQNVQAVISECSFTRASRMNIMKENAYREETDYERRFTADLIQA